MSSQEIRIDILLPLYYNDGRKLEEEKFYQTNLELSKRFGGCTALMPTKGTWIDPENKQVYNDINSGFFTIAPKTDETIGFLKSYKEILKERFQQTDVMMTVQDIQRI